jgi:hypothetical protein
VTYAVPSRAIWPARWIPSLSQLLPTEADQFLGVPATRWIAIAYLILITVRSGIHLLAADGGASSIATVDLSVAGGQNIVAMFGQWGAIQLELAVLLWCLVLRYPGLTPLVLMVFSVEPALRSISGHLKRIGISNARPVQGCPQPCCALVHGLAPNRLSAKAGGRMRQTVSLNLPVAVLRTESAPIARSRPLAASRTRWNSCWTREGAMPV